MLHCAACVKPCLLATLSTVFQYLHKFAYQASDAIARVNMGRATFRGGARCIIAGRGSRRAWAVCQQLLNFITVRNTHTGLFLTTAIAGQACTTELGYRDHFRIGNAGSDK